MGALSVPEQYPTAGDKSVATKHGVPMEQESVSTFYLSALRWDEKRAEEHT